ncbi:MAG: hypothetical protein M3Z54_12730 [Gemmatimonadota bacterium]|nr:hypothetical protein [Gemmatimonadota bacterium]
MLRIANGVIAAEVLPTMGAKIWSLTHLASQIQWIWHRPGVIPSAVASDAVYDEVWPGGWEEIFPNDAPGNLGDSRLTDHGEWWRRAWRVVSQTQTSKHATIALAMEGETVTASYEKWIRLERGSNELVISYRIRNVGRSPIVSLFKQHLPIVINPERRLELPGGNLVPVDPDRETILGPGPHAWPLITGLDGRPVDMRKIPTPAANSHEFVYVTNMPVGWCGVRNVGSNRAIRLCYSLDAFPFTWLFMTYGGWRGLYTVVLEPCTNMPKDLAEAHRQRQSLVLVAGQSFECSVRAVLT